MSYCRTRQINTVHITRQRTKRKGSRWILQFLYHQWHLCFTYTPSQHSTPGTTPLTHGPLDDIKDLTNCPPVFLTWPCSPVHLDTFSESHHTWCWSKSPALLYAKGTLSMVGPLQTQRQGRSSLLPRQPFERKLAHWHLHPAPSFSRGSQYLIFRLWYLESGRDRAGQLWASSRAWLFTSHGRLSNPPCSP